jgi:hypothetical protein
LSINDIDALANPWLIINIELISFPHMSFENINIIRFIQVNQWLNLFQDRNKIRIFYR